MNEEQELKNVDKNLLKLDKDTIKTNRNLLILTRWITVLTIVMVFVGLIQLIVMWPKRTYCIYIDTKIQICEPDYFPYDSNPTDAAYQLDKKLKL